MGFCDAVDSINRYLYAQFSPEIYALLRKKLNAHYYPFAKLKKSTRGFPTDETTFNDWVHFQSSSNAPFFTSRRQKWGTVIATSRIFFKCIYFLANSVRFTTTRLSRASKFSFIYSLHKNQIWHTDSLTDLYLFLNENRFDFQSDIFLVQALIPTGLPSKLDNLVVTPNIAIYLFRDLFTFREKILILRGSVKRFLVFFCLVLKHKELTLIGFDFIIEESIWSYFLRYSTPGCNAITTQSQLLAQPIIFELTVASFKLRKLMIWYSANSIPISYKNSPIRSLNDEIFTYASVDEHWVWTSTHGDYLTTVSGVKSVPKGSMLFYPRSLARDRIQRTSKQIVVFDVTPQEVDNSDNVIYSPTIVTRFMKDIISVLSDIEIVNGIKIDLLLKPKRDFGPPDSKEYLQSIEKWSLDGSLQLLAHQTNLYTIIDKSIAVIAIPFTSPALIARELNKPTCYYSDLDSIISPALRDDVPFIRSQLELKNFVLDTLRATDQS